MYTKLDQLTLFLILIIDDPSNSKCYVRWTLSTPAGWCVEDIKQKLGCVTQLSNFAIEFIYDGSIIIGTSASLDLIIDPKKFSMVFTEFLQNFVKVCEIDSTTADIVDVEIFASTSKIESKFFCHVNLKRSRINLVTLLCCLV